MSFDDLDDAEKYDWPVKASSQWCHLDLTHLGKRPQLNPLPFFFFFLDPFPLLSALTSWIGDFRGLGVLRGLAFAGGCSD